METIMDDKEFFEIQNKRIKEIAGVLNGQKDKLDGIEDVSIKVKINTDIQEKEIGELWRRVFTLCNSTEQDTLIHSANLHMTKREDITVVDHLSWDDITTEYRNINPDFDQVQLNDLLSPEILTALEKRFGAPLERQRWDKWDCIVCFAAALIGTIADIFCSDIDNPISKKLLEYGNKVHTQGSYYKNFSDFQKWIGANPTCQKFEWLKHLSEMKIDHNNLAIDYRGPGYKGPYHRVLSGGHDLLRFLSAIWQIKNGTFIGVRPSKSGGSIINIADTDTAGAPYVTMDVSTAIVSYLLHIASDALTSTSLPIPGATILREMSEDHDFQVFIVKSYVKGYNFRHILSQGVAPAVIGIIIWVYNLIRYNIGNLYKKWKQLPYEEESVSGLKLAEMLTVSHGIVAAINVGKVIIAKNPMLLNIPQIMVFMKSAMKFGLKTFKRYDYEERYDRNRLYLEEGWGQIDKVVKLPYDTILKEWPQEVIRI